MKNNKKNNNYSGQPQKKLSSRIIVLIMTIIMILGFVLMPVMSDVYAEEDNSAVVVESFETGSLAAAIDKAKDGTDLNLIKKIYVSGGTLNSSDYSAVTGYPNIEYLELAGCETENGVIPDNALSSRNQLMYISLPKNTETIGAGAFANNRKLVKVSIPSTLRHIGDRAFEGCELVESFSVPAELETMGTAAFNDCKALKEFALPAALTSVPDSCFAKSSLTEIHLGPQITSIGNSAFSDCHGLKDVYFYGDTVPSVADGSFQNVKATFHVYEDSEGFDSLNNNFLTVADDMSEDSVYTPPVSADVPAAEIAAEETTAAEIEQEPEADEETTAAQTENVTENENEATAAQSADNQAEPAVLTSSGLSITAVIIIAVLCVVIGVLAALLAVNSKKKQ